jgi:hypothetical protein
MSALFPNNVKTLLVEIEENLRKIYWRKMFRNVCFCPDKLSITIIYKKNSKLWNALVARVAYECFISQQCQNIVSGNRGKFTENLLEKNVQKCLFLP